MAFMEALSQRPVAYYKLDQDVLIDSSGYNRAVSVTNRTNGIPTHSDSTRSLILNGVSALTLGSPVFVSNRDSDFTLEADIVPIAQTEGNLPQTYRENLVLNPAASSNINNSIQSIGNAGGNTTYLSEAQMPTGKFVRKTWTATAGSMGFGYMTNSVPIGSYAVSFWVRSNLTTFNFYCVEGTAVETDASFSVTLSPGVWTRVTRVIGVTSPGTLKIGGFISASVNGDYLDISSPIVETGDTLNTYFDGNFVGFKWTGAAGASTSITDPEISAVNVVLNPSGNSLPSLQNQNGTISVSSEYAKFGTTSAKGVRGTGTGDNRVAIVADSYLTGKTNYASAWVYTLTARRVKLEVARRFGVTGGENFVGQSSFQDIPANTWTKLTLPFDAGDYSTLRRIQVVGINFPEGEPMWVDGMLVSSVDTDYFDGSMPGHKWSGAADNSYSYKLVSNGLQSIVSNSNDGLTINGTVLSFSTRHGDGSIEAKCSYDLGERTRTHVTAQHTRRKNTLYVDDEIVAEVDVPELALYAPATTLTSGSTNSGQALAINNIGIYDRILSRGEIAINSSASAYFFSNDTQSVFQAEEVDVSTIVYSPYFVQEYTSAYPGIMTNVVESFNELVPSEFNGAAVAGTWEFTVPLSLVDNPKTLTNSYVQWSGSGFTVQASLVTDVWFDVVENRDIVPLRNYNGQDKEITFRVTFTEGAVNAYLSMFKFVTFADLTFSKNGFTYTMNNDVRAYEEGIVFEQTEKRGISVGSSFSFKRDATEEFPQPVKTIELVVKQTGNVEPTLNAAYSPTAGYTNGEAVNTYTKGAYVIKHVVAPAGIDLSQNATLSGEFDLMSIKLYPDALTQDQIKQIIATYTGTIKTRVNDTNVVGVSETATSTSIYAYDWSTSSSRGQ